MILKSIGVLSCGKVLGVLYAAIGLLVGVVIALISLSGAVIPQQANGPNPVALFVGFGFAAIIVLPIMYGIMGFIGGIICAAIYNLVAAVVGGLELEFEPPASTTGMP